MRNIGRRTLPLASIFALPESVAVTAVGEVLCGGIVSTREVPFRFPRLAHRFDKRDLLTGVHGRDSLEIVVDELRDKEVLIWMGLLPL